VDVKAFFSSYEQKYRFAAVGSSIAMGALALILIFSILGAIFNLPFIGIGFGAFLVGAYGVLAILIPIYLVWAALILADPTWRPDRIFVLAAAIIPFMTIAIGIGFIQDFDFQAGRFEALRKAGRNGLSFFIILLTFVEGMIIRAFLPLLFPELHPARTRGAKTRDAKTRDMKARGALASLLRRRSAGPSLPVVPETVPAGDTAPAEAAIISFPEPKPLASVRAFEDIQRIAAANAARNAEEPPADTSADGEPAGSFDPEIDPEIEDGGQESYGKVLYYKQIPEEPDFPIDDDSDDDDDDDSGDDEDDDDDPEADESARYAGAADGEPETLDAVPLVKPSSAAPLLDSIEILDEGESAAARKPAFVSTPPLHTAPNRAAKKKLNRYRVPVEGLLNQYPDGQYWIIDQGTEDAAVVLQKTLEEFNIQAEVTGIKKGPVITMFEILPAPGVKLSKIVNLQDNIALRLAASSVRIVAPIPGKHAVGIEVPNKKRNIVSFQEIIEGELQEANSKAKDGKEKKQGIPVALGKDITGEAQTADLTQMPHLLIAGSTGSGKSVCVNAIILSILYQLSPAECRLILIDPKIVELKLYNDIPHLLTPVITEPKRAFQALQYCIYEMERRYACLDSMGVRDIKSYNKRIRERNIATEHMPYIVVIIDEFADLMATTGKELESTVARLAAMSRAVGIHLVLATQRPSIDVITGLIKANIPSRIAFMVAGKIDSRIIIDQVGAEKLLGKGDMLYAGVVDPFPIRMQGAFVSEEEVEKVVGHVKTLGEPDYIDDEMFYDEDEEDAGPSLFSDGEDPLYDKALEIVVQQGKASASYIQRRLKIGYNRSARIVEEMAARGVVGPAQGSKPRELLRGA
jgi:S-DNA-T family DNA segregation ATPase FtsK/SpoIIIE